MLPEYLVFKTPNASSYEDSILLTGNVRISIITSRLIRIEQGGFTDCATLTVINRQLDSPKFSVSESNEKTTITTDDLELTYLGGEITHDSLYIRSLKKPYFEWHYGDMPLHNLGGTVSTLDNIDGACKIDDGICSIDGYSIIDDSENTLMTADGWFEKRPEGILDIYFLGYGHDYETCIKDYCRLTGACELLPAFVFGNWWSRYHKYTDKEYLDLMDEFESHDIPLSVGIVDMDWHLTDGDGREYWTDGWTGYTWNRKYFPDYKNFLKELGKRNLKTALNLHPASGVRHWEDQYEDMAKAMGIDPKTKKPVSFDCLNHDFLKAYFEILLFPYERDGVNFWWMDWQQGIDYEWIHQNGGEKNDLECIHPLWMLNHMHYLAAKKDNKRGFAFSRFAGLGTQRYPIGFSGDTVISWASLDFQPYFTATASNVGYGWWSHDIGGHMGGKRDDELTARWIQFGVFSPIFRLHSTSNQFSSREPWNYNKRAELVMADFMRLRHRLFPYIYTMNHRNYAELIPLMRPMYHSHPENDEAYRVKNQYWFGSELVTCPITSPADNISDMGKAQVWLPDGKWIDFFTGYVYDGGRELEIHRPLETMPLFIKAGGIIPMQPHSERDNSLGRSHQLEVVVAAGASGRFSLYEDDGESLNYKNGGYVNTEFKLNWAEDSSEFVISPVCGDSSLVPEKRDYKITFRGFAKGCSFSQPYEYDEKTNSYTVTLKDVDSALGASVTVNNAASLIHDNSDWYNRVVDIITRAQCSFEYKDELMKKVHEAIQNGGTVSNEAEKTPYDSLTDAVCEIMLQAKL